MDLVVGRAFSVPDPKSDRRALGHPDTVAKPETHQTAYDPTTDTFQRWDGSKWITYVRKPE